MKVRFRPAVDPAAVNGIRAPYAPAQRRKPAWRWYLLLLVVGSPLLWFLGSLAWRSVNILAPGYVSLDRVDVRTMESGLVQSVRVAIGAHVHAGDTVAILLNPELAAERDAVRAQLATFDGASAPAGSATMRAVEAQTVDLARERVGQTEQRLQTYTWLEGRGAATDADVRSAAQAVNAARADVLHAQSDLVAVRLNPDIVALRSRLAGLEARMRAQRALATVDGDIVALAVRPGDQVDPGGVIATIGLNNRPHVLAYLDPRDGAAAYEGEHATVTFPTGQHLRAHLTKISRLARQLPTTFVSPLATRPDTIELTFDLDEPTSIATVDGLPIRVHLDGLRI